MISRKDYFKATENYGAWMPVFIKVNLRIILSMGGGKCFGRMERSMRAGGRAGLRMGRGR